ncbi:redoxin domain-containing protein [Arthrobacter bambusae]|uniref:redoxin domain-containing protein n=1 Tax=Arthrobacter bambusae TaxID=1338426 RepID=UPI001F5130F0|nr:redoxin domain-containing protein [Arthrobacter bambusae]MCI0141092.1 redoxin domain-containing protein [Arthrobacter bambusae]
MRTAPPSTDPATNRRRLIAAAIWAIAGLAIAASVAGIFLVAPSKPGTTAATPAPVTVEPGIDAATARLLQLDVLHPPLDNAPDFTLTAQDGKPVSLSQYRGKSVVLSFNDDQCQDLCTLLAQDVTEANRDLGAAAADVVFLSINANTAHPAVGDVKAWTEDHGLASETNWVFGTGTPDQLTAVAAKYHVPIGVDPQTHDVVHGSELFFINPAGKEAAIGQFGTESANTALFAHGMAQMAVDLVPGRPGATVGGPASSSATAAKPAELGQAAPGFTLPRLGNPGTRTSLDGTKGKYTVVNFWASTCTACTQEMPDLQQAHQDLGSSTAFLGIDVADPAGQATDLAARSGTTYPLLADTNGTTAGAYQISGLPFTAIIAPDGTLLVRHPGTFTAEQLEYVLHTLENNPQ